MMCVSRRFPPPPHPRRPLRRPQAGMTLMIVLIFLIILTLFVVTGINTGIVNLRIANNTQASIESQAAAQHAVEAAVGTLATFTSPATTATTSYVDINLDGTNDYTLVRQPPVCLSSAAADGFGYENVTLAPQDTVWLIVVTASDSRTGVSTTIRQGVKVRLENTAVCVN